MSYRDNNMSVRISKDVHKMLQEYKKETGVAISFTIEKAVQEYLKRKKGGKNL